MQKSDFYYDLPERLIAQSPATPRDAARLMTLERVTGAARHHRFSELPGLLKPGDLLVLNSSKVIPARLLGRREGHAGVCELLLLRQLEGDEWEALARPGRRIRGGDRLSFGDGSLTAEVLQTLPGGGKRVLLHYDTPTLYEKLDAFGAMPLPHYIRKQLANNDDYQTVYARQPGSAAAPTAGLHFTRRLLDELAARGINTAEVCLHVGLGTFRPVQAERIEDHLMHSEWFSLDEAAAQTIRKTQKNGGRVVAVGTTACRVLESVAGWHGEFVSTSGQTDIFIYPGYTFKAVDALITNFHLPESTLIMLVSAFCGRENTLAAYAQAIQNEYRFYSFGDAMLII